MSKHKTVFRTFLLAAVLAMAFTAMPVLAAQEKNLIVASARTSGRTAVLHWNRVSGATEYTIYRSIYKEGEAAPRVKEVKTVKGTTYQETGMKTGYDYSFRVAASKGGDRICASPLVITYAGKRAATGKAVSVTPEGSGIGVIVGNVTSAKCIVKTDNGKKQERGLADIRYYSTNPKVASVDDNGNLTGVSVGTCRIYMVAVNGVNAWTEVSVLEKPVEKDPDPAPAPAQTVTYPCSTCYAGRYLYSCSSDPYAYCGYPYYGQWPYGKRAYTVTFLQPNGRFYTSMVVVAGAKVYNPDPTVEVWYTDPGYWKKYDFNSAVNSNMILYARKK